MRLSVVPGSPGDLPGDGGLQRMLGRLPAPPESPAAVGDALRTLVEAGHDRLPRPGGGDTLGRWRTLAAVAGHDLSLAKLYEGHTDALAIHAELGAPPPPAGSTWGMWAAEAPACRVLLADGHGSGIRLTGRKAWCSGAANVSHALLTVWQADGTGPWLAAVALAQPGVRVTGDGWQAVGMAASASVDVVFDGAVAQRIGTAGDYLSRPGFWHGSCGVAACWYGGAVALAETLRAALVGPAAASATPFKWAALGHVDVALSETAALLAAAAAAIDAAPHADVQRWALRTRASAERCAETVLAAVGHALGAAPYCRDAAFARRAADLPVFIRQSHAERDLAALGAAVAASAGIDPWGL